MTTSEDLGRNVRGEKMQFLLPSQTLKESKKVSPSLSLLPGVSTFSGSKLLRLVHYLYRNPKFLLSAMEINLVCIGPENYICLTIQV